MARKTNGSAKKKKTVRVNFDYIKASSHRVIFASGAHGGPTPSGDKIVMSLYNERLPIPLKESFEVDEEGRVDAKSRSTTQRKGFVREVEATVILDVATAKSIQGWLGDQIKKIEGLRKGK